MNRCLPACLPSRQLSLLDSLPAFTPTCLSLFLRLHPCLHMYDYNMRIIYLFACPFSLCEYFPHVLFVCLSICVPVSVCGCLSLCLSALCLSTIRLNRGRLNDFSRWTTHPENNPPTRMQTREIYRQTGRDRRTDVEIERERATNARGNLSAHWWQSITAIYSSPDLYDTWQATAAAVVTIATVNSALSLFVENNFNGTEIAKYIHTHCVHGCRRFLLGEQWGYPLQSSPVEWIRLD